MNIRNQINQLKSRNLRFKNIKFATIFLTENNYYNVVNGTKDLFLDSSLSIEKYKPNTYFEDLAKIYLFDKKLRSLCLNNIFIIEDKIKTVFATCLTNNGYVDIYKNPSCYINSTNNPSRFINNEINKSIRNSDPMILHFNNNSTSFVPVWALVNILSIGCINKIYDSLKPKVRYKIASKFNLNTREFSNFLEILVFYRNKCAHCYKLFSTKVHFGHGQIVDTKYHIMLHINTNSGIYWNKNSLFSIVLIFKTLLNKKQYKNFNKSFSILLNKLKIYLYIRRKRKLYFQILKIIGVPLKDKVTKQKSWKKLLYFN